MVGAGLCTDEQYEAGKAELLRRITRAYDRIDGSEDAVHVTTTAEAKNEWSSSEDEEGDTIAVVTQSSKKAEAELELYLSYMKSCYQPQMEATKTLGAYDDDGNLREAPIYAIGKVTKRGLDLPSRFNLADYVNRKGHFDLVNYVMDHSIATSIKKKPPFVGTGNVIIGQLAPHIDTEVDCESLFSQAGHLSQPNRSRTTAETFERMVMAKHRLARIYCCPKMVKKEFHERHKRKSWSNEEDRDDLAFWEGLKREYLQDNPTHRAFVDELEEAAKVAEYNEDGVAETI